MALVVFLRGVNVGGHKTFRPSVVAGELARFGVVNIGAAGTFVVRTPPSRTKLREELMRRLPFEADAMICSGADILRLVADDPFAAHRALPDITQFVSVAGKRLPPVPSVPLQLPATGPWCLKVLERRDRFLIGMYRRQMTAIGYLGKLDKLLGVPVTTRNWNTIVAIERILKG